MRPDCILSYLKTDDLSSITTPVQVSERLSYPIITDLDSNAADHPISNVITVGFGHYPSSLLKFPREGGNWSSKGLPDNKVFRHVYHHARNTRD